MLAWMKNLLWPLLLWLPAASAVAEFDLSAVERRKPQYPTDAAHLLVPLPYSMPGIGQGYFLMGYLSNIHDTASDLALLC